MRMTINYIHIVYGCKEARVSMFSMEVELLEAHEDHV